MHKDNLLLKSLLSDPKLQSSELVSTVDFDKIHPTPVGSPDTNSSKRMVSVLEFSDFNGLDNSSQMIDEINS